MELNKKYSHIASDDLIAKTVSALKANGMDAIIVGSGAEAKEKALGMIPEHAEVMTMTSRTLEATGIAAELNESGRYDSVRKKLSALNRETQAREMRKLGSAPDWVIGSVHSVTEDGEVYVASASGSQLPAYVYGAGRVIWVVGAQKIVKNKEEAFERIETYTFPLEDERAQQAYGMHSSISKLLIVNKEMPGRITVIIVKENIGF